MSLFAGITGGIDWNDLLKPLEDQLGPWLALVFVLYIAFAVLATWFTSLKRLYKAYPYRLLPAKMPPESSLLDPKS